MNNDMRNAKQSLIAVWVLALSGVLSADVILPSVFSDGMVLQQNSRVPIFGKAAPEETVTVEFAGQKKTATVDSSSHWKIMLDPMPASSTPRKMTIRCSNHPPIQYSDLLVGEVWLCSGQSNMEMSMQPFPPWHGGTLNYQQEIAAADYPAIRFFYVEKRASRKPEFTCGGQWETCRPATAAGFPAAAYFFARRLHTELDVPIGVINSSWGSTAIESWMPLKALESSSDFKMIVDHLESAMQQREPDGRKDFSLPTACYNGLIAPVVPYALRGVIWYQGEANAPWPEIYERLFTAMIHSWREQWSQPEMPFYFVQLASLDTDAYAGLTPDKWARLRQSQLAALSLTNTGMAVAADISDPNQIHPRNKQAVGRRLAFWALAKCYGKNIAFSGPIYKSMAIDGNEITVSFDCTNGGLMARSDALDGFAVAGKDRNFVKAQARIDGDTVVVSSSEIQEPVSVRYGWTDHMHCSLYNEAQLPASPFRTDSWDDGATF